MKCFGGGRSKTREEYLLTPEKNPLLCGEEIHLWNAINQHNINNDDNDNDNDDF